MKCKICKKEFKNFVSLGTHISKTHKISIKEYPEGISVIQRYYDKFLKLEGKGICTECGKETKFIDLGKGYHKFCSRKCAANSKEVQDQIKETCIKHFGVEHPIQSKEIKDQIKETCLEKYNAEHPFQSQIVKEKIKQTNLEKYGVENPSQTQEARERMKNGGAVHASSFIKNPSKPQVELYNLVKSLYEESILNFPTKGKSGKSYSLDITIPSLKIDIEYDGSYWHQDKEKDEERQKDLEEAGWKFLRYRDYMPTLEELNLNVEILLMT